MHVLMSIGMAIIAILAYILSTRFIGNPLAVSSWNVWNESRTGRWAYFLFPASSQLRRIGYKNRYGYFFNPQIVEIADSAELSLRNGRWENEGRTNYIGITAMFWPLKLATCALSCVIVLAFKALSISIKYLHQRIDWMIYSWTKANA